MADGIVQVPPDSTGKKIDAASMDVGANTVMRQRIVIGDNSATAAFALVTNGALTVTGTFNISAMPTVTVTGGVAISGTATIAGIVGLTAGTAVIGDINAISRTVQVAISTPFTINNISATVLAAVTGTVNLSGTPSVVLAAGTANFGTLNDISRTVQVAIGTPFILQGISTTVLVAVSTPFTINNISATVVVSGLVGLTAGTANIGFINNISASVLVATGATADFNTLASADQIQTLPIFGIALPASGGAVAGGTSTNPVVVAGTIGITGTVNISGTPSVVLAAGTANFGTLNNISATVTIVGVVNISATASVILAAGTANFGTLNGISATVVTGLSYIIEKTTNSQVQVGDSANAAIRVNVVAGSAGGPSMTDNTTYSTGVSLVAPSGYIFFSASAVAVTDGRVAAARITEFRAVHANLRTNGGVALDDTANSALRVNVVAGGAAGGTSLADGAPFTVQTTAFTPIGGEVDDIAPGILAEGSAGAVRVTPNRAFHVNLRDSAGAELGAASATGLFIRTATIALAADQILGSISRTVQVAVGTPFTINNISATTIVAGVISLGAGINNIGFINNISATVVVSGLIGLTAGTANIGFINNISATVIVAGVVSLGAGTNLIGAVSNAAGTALMGAVSLAAGTANIGFINNISATVMVAVANTPLIAFPSASHGPKCVTASTSVGVVLIAAPGAGNHIYITEIACTNGSGTLTRADVFQLSATASCAAQMYMAASGGGFVRTFDPPIKCQSNTQVTCRVDPDASKAVFNVNFYVDL